MAGDAILIAALSARALAEAARRAGFVPLVVDCFGDEDTRAAAAGYRQLPHALTRGFAAVAWPAKYGNSGVMTFLVNHRDIVYQKDLGPGTAELAAAIRSFDPDATWEPTRDSIDQVEDDGEAEGEEAVEAEAAEAAGQS